MKTTFTISGNTKATVFEILEKDLNDIIMLINFYLRLGNEQPVSEVSQPKRSNTNKRIRVNDKTATGGWY